MTGEQAASPGWAGETRNGWTSSVDAVRDRDRRHVRARRVQRRHVVDSAAIIDKPGRIERGGPRARRQVASRRRPHRWPRRPARGHRPAAAVIRIASVESEETPEGQAITTFADELTKRTGGSITVLPIFETAEGGDPANIDGVHSGLIDMAIVQARAWDEYDVTSMQALQTPFLLGTEDAAVAATSGTFAPRLTAGLDDQDVVGLMLWPIDLRHFVSFKKPYLDPKDLAGERVRIIGSTINQQVVTTLGATPVGDYGDGATGGESAFDRAYSLPGPGTFTGNVTLYPRIDLMFISRSTFDGLTPAQQTAVREAADATREILVKDIVPDAVQAQGYCRDEHGSVAIASADQVKAFQTALAPVEATIVANPVSKSLVADLRAMVKDLPAGAPVEACGPG